jgi:hypothetical protein
MYVVDHDNKYPYYAYAHDSRLGSTIHWYHALRPYYVVDFTTNRTLHCPGYRGRVDGVVTPNSDVPMLSYGYNTYGTGPPLKQNDPILGLGGESFPMYASHEPPVSESQVKVPAEMLAIGDARLHRYYAPPRFALEWVGGPTISPWLSYTNSLYPPRHGKNYNVVCCDGHVVGMTPGSLFNQTNTAVMWNNDHQAHPETWFYF